MQFFIYTSQMDKNKIANIKAVIFDSVGVLFSPHVLYDAERGEVLRERSHIDGQGISLLRSAGIPVAFVSSETSGFLEKLTDKLNSLASVKNGDWQPVALFAGLSGTKKEEALVTWLQSLNLTLADCAYMGDDIGDYTILTKVGFKAAPAQAEEIMRSIADWTSPREGGRGAVRDLCNAILDTKGIDPLTLSQK